LSISRVRFPGEVRHKEWQDLESLYWILVYMMMRYKRGVLIRWHSPLDSSPGAMTTVGSLFGGPSAEAIGGQKRLFLMDYITEVKFTDEDTIDLITDDALLRMIRTLGAKVLDANNQVMNAQKAPRERAPPPPVVITHKDWINVFDQALSFADDDVNFGFAPPDVSRLSQILDPSVGPPRQSQMPAPSSRPPF